MTNGEVFQKIFPCEEIHINGLQDGIVHFSMTSNLKSMDCFSLEWWNAEYNGSFAVPEREKGEWIPVSEWLPVNTEYVLATDGLDMFVAWHNPEKERYKGWHSFDENFDVKAPILAWQPLPEPYKAESEDMRGKAE